MATRRAARLRAGALLALGVLILHLWLLASAPAFNRAGESAPDRAGLKSAAPLSRAVSTLAPRPTLAPVAARLAQAAQAAQAAERAQAAEKAQAAETAPAAKPAPSPARRGRVAAGGTSAAARIGAGLASSVSRVEESTDAPAPPSPMDLAAPTQPPPVYATRMPAPVELHYALQLGGHNGQARLTWQHDGAQYLFALRAQGAPGAPRADLPPGTQRDHGPPGTQRNDGPPAALLQQSSRGGFDAAGLAPERFVDQRRGRGALAANFNREQGRITFSGPRIEHPSWPGAQDRLGWIVQLAAIAEAAGQMPAQVAMFVVDGRGVGDVWTFVNQGEVMLDTPQGAMPATHVRREPQRLLDWRVEAWLDAQHGHWPLRLRMTVPRSGAVLELQRVAGPGPP